MNQRQIVAGSGELDKATHWVTSRVLEWCYDVTEPACGWAEDADVGVAFRRTPTGRDSLGREGAFFVHALVWSSGTLPVGILAGLWESEAWVTAPPREPPPKLQPITDAAELRLRPPPPVDRALVVGALAARLRHLAERRPSAILLPQAEAYLVAARIAEAMPRRFGLPAFSTHEEPSRRSKYDLVVMSDEAPPFAPISSSSDSGPDALAAAELLHDALDGDRTAGQVREALASSSANLAEFAERLCRWGGTEAARPPEVALDPAPLAMAVDEPAALKRLLAKGRGRGVARGVLNGAPAQRLLSAATAIDELPTVLAALRDELHAEGVAAAARSLARLTGELGEHARALAADVGDAWLRGDDSRDLPADVTIALLRLLPASATRIVDRLVRQPSTAQAVVDAGDLSPTLRGRAAAANTELVDPYALARSLAESGTFARGFHASAGRASMSVLADTLTHVPPDLARDALDVLGAMLDDEQRFVLVLPVARALPPTMSYGALVRHAPSDRVPSGEWADVAVEALVEAVLVVRDRRTPLVRVVQRPFRGAESERARRWGQLGWHLEGDVFDRDVADAAGVAAGLSARDADAAVELVVDVAADHLRRDFAQWGQAVSAVHIWSREPTLEFAQRLARAALRDGATSRRDMPRWTVLWVASALAQDALDRGDLYEGPLAQLSARLGEPDIDRLRTFVKKRTKRGPARSWIKDNIAAAGRGLDD